MYIPLIVALLAILVIWRWYNSLIPPRLNLPYPPGYPIIGNVKELDSAPHERLTALAEIYGPVYALRIFNKNIIVVNSYEMLKEVLITKGSEYAGRPKGRFRTNYLFFGKTDLALCNPDVPYWTSARKTIIHNLKIYDTGLERLEGVLKSATKEVMEKVRAKKGEPFDINLELYNYTMKMIFYFTTGINFTDGDPSLVKLKEMDSLILTNDGLSRREAIIDAFPFLRHFGNESFKKLVRGRALLVELWETFQSEHEMNPENPLYKASCMYALRELQNNLKDNNGKTLMDDKNSRNIVSNLWIAGIVTTSNNLYALINILCQNPLVAKRIQEEVDSVVGNKRQVSLKDKNNLHYTRAAIFESLRYCTLTNLALPHVTTRTTQLCGASIPEGTQVLINMWAAHHDKEFWNDPWVYRPERFLDEEGLLLPPEHDVRKHLLTFGAGPRMCIGSVLALNRMLIFTASLMQKFNLFPDPEHSASYDPRTYGMANTLRPKPYKARFILRAE